MNIPIFWLKDYIKLPNDLANLTNKLTLVGHMLDKITQVDNETVVDLELRGNRADCYSLMGIAREVSALYKTPVKNPPSYHKLKRVTQLAECKNTIKTGYVKRVMMVALKDVIICNSPLWLKKRLNAYDIPSINNIVDLTNFVMLETGEPTHAFDLDKLGNEIEIRLAKDGEKMTTFLDQTLTLTKDDLVWANKDSLLSIAGAIGAKHRSILPSTKNVLLEAASYDRVNIRKSIYRHNLLTDAGIRHEKDLDPNLVEPAIYRYLQIISENKWGTIIPYIFDYYPKPVKPWPVNLVYSHLENLAGVKVKPSQIEEILSWLNCKIVNRSVKGLKVLIPTYRTDVTLEEDLIEEILRIYGYDQIPIQTLDLEIPKDVTPPYIYQEINLKNAVSALGFDEAITLSFVKEKYQPLNKNLEVTNLQPVAILNAPSPDTKMLRASLLPNLYEVAKKAIDERSDEIALFEIGKIFIKSKKGYKEKRKLGLIYWKKDFAQINLVFKGYLEALFKKISLEYTEYRESLDVSNLSEAFEIIINKDVVGVVGKYQNFNFAEIYLDAIIDKTIKLKAYLWPKFPPQIEDLTLTFPGRTKIGDVLHSIMRLDKLISKAELTTIFNDAYTFRLWYQDPNKTLTDLEVTEIRKKILKVVKQKFGGVLKNP